MPKSKAKTKKGKGVRYETKPLKEYEKLVPKMKTVEGEGIGDFFQRSIEKSGLEAHMLGQAFPPKRMSFCGPGTRLDKRLNPDGTWKEWSKPWEYDKYGKDALDYGCYKHDLAYTSSGDPVKDNQIRREADKALVEHAKNWKKIKEANNDMGMMDKVNYQIVDKVIGGMSKGSGCQAGRGIPDINKKIAKLIN